MSQNTQNVFWSGLTSYCGRALPTLLLNRFFSPPISHSVHSSCHHSYLCCARCTPSATPVLGHRCNIHRSGNRAHYKHAPACQQHLYVSMPHTPSASRNDLNVSRRLRRMLKASGLPRVGKAYHLRMRYVQLTHVLCILQRRCNCGSIISAMSYLLEGWDATEEQHSHVGG